MTYSRRHLNKMFIVRKNAKRQNEKMKMIKENAKNVSERKKEERTEEW